jgi:hypothetical protein
LKSSPPERKIKSDASLAPDTPVTHFGFPRTVGDTDPRRGKEKMGVAVTRGQVRAFSFIQQYESTSFYKGKSAPPQLFFMAPRAFKGGSGGGVFNDQGVVYQK